MEELSGRVIDRTRSRLDIPAVRTSSGLTSRPRRSRAGGPPAQEIVAGNSRYGLTWFRISFGKLQVKDCADVAFIADGLLDQMPQPSLPGATRTGGIALSKPRIRAALSAALALAASPHGFTVAQHAAAVQRMTGIDGYTVRQSAYDLRKLRCKNLAVRPGQSRRCNIPPQAVRTIAALLALRDQVIAPIIAGVRSPRKPAHWTRLDRDYETLRIGMQTLFHDLGIATPVTAAA